MPHLDFSFYSKQACLEQLRAGQNVMVVCFTNHALDQFLLMLESSGVTEMARVGERSRSPQMEKYMMGTKMREGRGTRRLSHALRASFKAVELLAKDCETHINDFFAKVTPLEFAVAQGQARAGELRRRMDVLQRALLSTGGAGGGGNRSSRKKAKKQQQGLEEVSPEALLYDMQRELEMVVERTENAREQLYNWITEDKVDAVRGAPYLPALRSDSHPR